MAPSCSAALSEKSQQQGTSAHPCHLHPHTDSARDGGIKAPSLHQLLGHQLGMLQNTPLTNLCSQLWRMECGGDLFLGKRQSIPVLLSQQRCQGTEASLHNRNQVLHGGGGPSPAISDAFVLTGDLDTPIPRTKHFFFRGPHGCTYHTPQPIQAPVGCCFW